MSPLKDALIAQLLSHFDTGAGQITEGAVRAAQALLDTFIRETILRAHADKRDRVATAAINGPATTIMLETDDLERVLGQMIVDFS